MADIFSLALCCVRGIGPAIAKKLMEVYPSAQALFEESEAALRLLFGKKEKTIEDILKRPMFSRCEKELEFMYKNNIRAYFINDCDYPFRLRQIDSPPTCIFVKGNGSLDTRRVVSIVGSRHASDYGRWVTANIVKELRQYDVTIVSGLALGIDSAAHVCSLNENIPTFGVLGHGIDRIYPAQNYALAQSMLLQGGLVSEFFSNTEASNYNFPRRNRIIAALSDVCIVVEGGIRSGSMITPKYASEFNREVFAVPGRIGDTYSEGCNKLISDNIAISLSDISQIGKQMNWTQCEQSPQINANRPQPQPQTAKPLPQMTQQEKKVYDLLRQKGKQHIDDIMLECGLDFASCSVTLMNLELKDCIRALPGKCYECAR